MKRLTAPLVAFAIDTIRVAIAGSPKLTLWANRSSAVDIGLRSVTLPIGAVGLDAFTLLARSTFTLVAFGTTNRVTGVAATTAVDPSLGAVFDSVFATWRIEVEVRHAAGADQQQYTAERHTQHLQAAPTGLG